MVFFNPSVTTCHFAYILHGKTQGEKGGLFTLWFGIFFVQKGNSLRFPTEPIFSLIIDLACNSKKTEK